MIHSRKKGSNINAKLNFSKVKNVLADAFVPENVQPAYAGRTYATQGAYGLAA